MRLVNGPGRGWLRLETTVTGGKLSYIDLGNLPAWLVGVDLARALALGLLLGLLLLKLAWHSG